MKTTHTIILTILLAGWMALNRADAAEGADQSVELKLREVLKNTMLQLRDAQGQIATLQATQVASDQKVKDLEKKLDLLSKQSIADRNTSANMISELNTRVEEQRVINVGLQTAIEKWKKSYGEVTALAQKKESDRAKLDLQRIKLERQVQDQKVRNIKMYQTGLEILDRYEKFGLGDAIFAREPFVGSTRVKFQTLVQDDQDKLDDSRIAPTPSAPAPTTASNTR